MRAAVLRHVEPVAAPAARDRGRVDLPRTTSTAPDCTLSCGYGVAWHTETAEGILVCPTEAEAREWSPAQ